MEQTLSTPIHVARNRSRVTALGFTAFVLLGWSGVLIPTLVGSIEATFRRTDRGIALVYLIAAVLYAAGSLGGGLLAERIGARNVLAAAVALLGAGLIAQGIAPVWIVFVIAVAIGKGGGGAIDGGVQGVFLGLHTETKTSGGALNRLHVFYGLGALAGPAAVGGFVALGGNWRVLFIVSGVALLGLAFAIATTPGMPAGVRPKARGTIEDAVSASERSLHPFVWLAVAIACYEGAAMGVASWVVRYLDGSSAGFATVGLSIYWAGVSLSRLAAGRLNRLAEPVPFTSGCVLLSSVALAGAVLVPSVWAAVVLFGFTGFFMGPVYPMIMAIGGDLYPKRLSALSGALSTAATAGAIVYPPLMGLMASGIGIRAGFLGAAALGAPTIGAIYAAKAAKTRPRDES